MGEQHERFIKGWHKTKKGFEKQLEHDNRKCIYTDNNKINLLIIWYWDFDNIEEILSKAIVDEFNVTLENDDSIRTASKFGKKINDGVV